MTDTPFNIAALVPEHVANLTMAMLAAVADFYTDCGTVRRENCFDCARAVALTAAALIVSTGPDMRGFLIEVTDEYTRKFIEAAHGETGNGGTLQ